MTFAQQVDDALVKMAAEANHARESYLLACYMATEPFHRNRLRIIIEPQELWHLFNSPSRNMLHIQIDMPIVACTLHPEPVERALPLIGGCT